MCIVAVCHWKELLSGGGYSPNLVNVSVISELALRCHRVVKRRKEEA